MAGELVSGLGAALGFGVESTYGTYAAPTVHHEFNEASLQLDIERLDSVGIKQGQKATRRSRSRHGRLAVTGSITMEAPDRGMTALYTQMFGLAPSSGVYNPASQFGKSLTIQRLTPRVNNATAKVDTFLGNKITGVEFSCQDNSIATWTLTVEGQDKVTTESAAAVAYTAGAKVFGFNDAAIPQVDFSGTAPTLTSGVVTLASPANIAGIIKGATFNFGYSFDLERYGLGNQGKRSAPLENGFDNVEITLDMEHDDSVQDWWTAFKNDTTVGLSFSFEAPPGEGEDSGGVLDFYFPACAITSCPRPVTGPEIVQQQITLRALDPEVTGMKHFQIVDTAPVETP